MNRFVDILNIIRQKANPNWLTPSQQAAYHLLRERLNFLDEVNLWGGQGVGKTFLGWVLRAQGLAIFAPRLEDVGQEQALPLQRTIVVDNLDWRRTAVREALHHCRSHGYDKIVLITNEFVQDQVATVEVALTDDDIAQVAANLRSIGVAPYNDTPHSLWDLVSPVELTR
jgi:hypothetical protein